MKKTVLLLLAIAISSAIYAGGIQTNTNQSAAYARMLSRNASLGIDAVYYNPAGLTKLGNGLYFSLNNQSIFQTKDVTNHYRYLHGAPDALYTGKVSAPLFPGVYLAYKVNKFAFSFGFNPVGGGGGAKYDTGLPSFETPVSDLVPSLAEKFGVTDYKAAINFEGTSVYFGYQFGVSYEVNPSFSVFGGVRYVTAKNTYKGAIKDIMVNPSFTAAPAIPGLPTLSFDGSFVRADALGSQLSTYYGQAATYYTGVAAQMTAAATGLNPLVAGGAGGLTPAQAQGAGIITAAQRATIEGGLAAIGQPATLTIQQAQGAFSATATQATAGAAQLTGGAAQMDGLAAKTGDKEVDVEQNATSYTPIIGANFTLGEKVTLAVKYEFMTKIDLKNKTTKDDTGLFPNDSMSRSDMPAMLSIGVSSPLTDKLSASLSFNYYFDKNANYGKKDDFGALVRNRDVIDHNFFELGVGFEYSLSDALMLSAGALHARTGVSKAYQSDMSYSLTSNTIGLGGKYNITPNIALNLGVLNTFYDKNDHNYYHVLGTQYNLIQEDLAKTTWMVAVGVDVKLGK